MTRFGAAVERVDERIPGIDLPLLSVSQTRGVIRRTELTDKPPRAESLDVYKVCRKNDIVFNKMSIRSGALGVAHEDGLVTYHYEVMRPKPGVSGRYLVYLMKSAWFTGELIARERGIGAGDQGGAVRTTEVPFKVLRTVHSYIPTADRQRVIADHLDHETAKIDSLIVKQEQLIATLRERRAAGINEALAAIAPRLLTRLKHVASVQSGVTLSGEGDSEAPEWPYLRVANVQVGHIDVSDVKTMRLPTQTAASSMLRPGDVLMTEGGDIDKLGRGAVWDGDIDPMLHQNHVFAVRPGDRLLPHFLAYWLDSPIARRYFRTTARKTTNLASTNMWTLGNLPVACPLVQEQQATIAYLDEKNAKIDSLIGKTERFITLAKERRAALIAAAVTGQLDAGEAS